MELSLDSEPVVAKRATGIDRRDCVHSPFSPRAGPQVVGPLVQRTDQRGAADQAVGERPLRCGHSACVANTPPARVRNTAMRWPPTAKVRPSPSGICATGPIRIAPVMSPPSAGMTERTGSRSWRRRLEPGIVGGLDRRLHRRVELRRDALRCRRPRPRGRARCRRARRRCRCAPCTWRSRGSTG